MVNKEMFILKNLDDAQSIINRIENKEEVIIINISSSLLKDVSLLEYIINKLKGATDKHNLFLTGYGKNIITITPYQIENQKNNVPPTPKGVGL